MGSLGELPMSSEPLLGPESSLGEPLLGPESCAEEPSEPPLKRSERRSATATFPIYGPREREMLLRREELLGLGRTAGESPSSCSNVFDRSQTVRAGASSSSGAFGRSVTMGGGKTPAPTDDSGSASWAFSKSRPSFAHQASSHLQRRGTTIFDAIIGDNGVIGHPERHVPGSPARPVKKISTDGTDSQSSTRLNLQTADRLISRAGLGKYGQRHRMNITRLNRPHSLFMADWFHTLIDIGTGWVVFGFVFVYCLCFAGFALFYWTFSDVCEFECDRYIHALFLSIETMMTIGYGINDPYFRKCPAFIIILMWQMFTAIFMDSLLVGLVYQRISRGTQRSHTILFSDKAVLRTVGHSNYFIFQVCEMRRSELLECHVRLYLFSRTEGSETPVEMHPMRLDQPDDSLGAMMILAMPAQVVHRVDSWSPLRSASVRETHPEYHGTFKQPANIVAAQRMSDCDSGSNDSVWCEACGASFARAELLRLHVQYSVSMDPKDKQHADLLRVLPKVPDANDIRDQINMNLESSGIEIVCLLEGIDPTTSSTVQARHSYTARDIVWDKDFAPCVCGAEMHDHGQDKTGICIDFDRFHELIDKPPHVHHHHHHHHSRHH